MEHETTVASDEAGRGPAFAGFMPGGSRSAPDPSHPSHLFQEYTTATLSARSQVDFWSPAT